MLRQLAEAVRRNTEGTGGGSPVLSQVPGLTLLRSDHPGRPRYMVFRPALCIVVQGAKSAVFGGKRIDYKAGEALMISIDMPALGTVAGASPSEPYLGLIIELDLAIMREVVERIEAQPYARQDNVRGFYLTELDGPLMECALRLMRLHETPNGIPVLYGSIMRELCYWLLTGPHGAEIMNMVVGRSHSPDIVHAIHWLRNRFMEQLRISELASIAHMSISAFHRKFKQITLLTPLQYQKQLRLLEARRMMAFNESNVETAAFKVGYESPSQFSREYARMFGVPPKRDIVSIHELVV
jgi:AraC-like DNA-binding protein